MKLSKHEYAQYLNEIYPYFYDFNISLQRYLNLWMLTIVPTCSPGHASIVVF